MIKLRSLALAIAGVILSVSTASAQIGEITSGHVLGNESALAREARGASLPSMLDRALCSTTGGFPVRTASTWQCSTAALSAPVINGGPLTINPTPLSLSQGLVITQTSPTSGTVVGPTKFNSIDVTSASGVTGGGGGETPYSDRYTAGLHVKYSIGANATGFQIGRMTRLNNTSATTNIGSAADMIGDAIQVVSNQNSTNHGIYAGNDGIWLQSGAAHSHVVGREIDVTIESGATATHRVGLRVHGATGTGTGSTADSAFAITSGGTSGGWLTAFDFGEIGNAQAIATTGSFFTSLQAMTVANFANLANVTVTGNIMSFPNYSVSGAGAIVASSIRLGDAIAGSTALASVKGAVATARFRAEQTDGASSTTGFSGFDTISDAGQANLVLFGTAFTGTGFGVTLGGWGRIQTSGASNNGLIIGTSTAKPIVIGYNNTETARWQTGLSVGLATDPGNGIVSALTGFRVNNAAASGNVLRGNGTNFISAALAAADLSNGVTGSGAVALAGSPTFTTLIETPKIIGGTGTGSSLVHQSTSGVGATDFQDFLVGNNGATRAMRILTDGKIIEGHTASIATISAVQPSHQLHSGVPNVWGQYIWSADTSGVNHIFSKSRGATVGTRGIVNSADTIGQFIWAGDDGTNFIPAAGIRGIVDGTPGTNDMPGALIFLTTGDGASALSIRMRLFNDGGMRMGTSATSPGAGLFYTNSASFMSGTGVAYNNGAAAAGGTLLNAPAAGNPTKWIPVDDAGTTRYLPAW